MKSKAHMTHAAYQTRHFTLALATSALTAAEITQLEQHSGMSMAQLAALDISVLASFPTDAISQHSPSLDPSIPNPTPVASQTLGSEFADSESRNTTDTHNADQFNAHRRARASVEAAPRLYLSYFINQPFMQQTLISHPIDGGQLAELLNWRAWQAQQVKFCDYLWEQTCLECFIGGQTSDYVEINANPSGSYALYHFSGYRQPDSMPPPPLYRPDNGARLQSLDAQQLAGSEQLTSNQRASIDWQSDMLLSLTADESAYPLANTLCRHFSLELGQLPKPLLPLTQLHPCIILMLGEIPLYYAPRHAQPPDFHDRAYWPSL